MSVSPPSPSSRPGGGGDPSIRRTWWLLAGAFFLLALLNGIRLVVERQPIDWLTVGLVIVAAIAAVAHRNAVGGLESRGRGEAESFARILRGLSRSVSADAIVSAIVEDLIEATAADHVVIVRRRASGAALEATLVTRRAGVPTTSTILPASLLDRPSDDGAAELVGIPIDVPPSVEAGAGDGVPPGAGVAAERTSLVAAVAESAAVAAAGPEPAAAAGPEPAAAGSEPLAGAAEPAAAGSEPLAGAAEPAAAEPAVAHPAAAVAAAELEEEAAAATVSDGDPAVAPVAVPPANGDALMPSLPTIARRASDRGGGRILARRAAAEGLALLRDIGLPTPDLLGSRGRAKPSEVLARGDEAVIAERVADRVRAAFGLSHSLTAPLRADHGVIGAIVLSRRDREAWPQAARRLLRVAATETAAALDRADSFRAAEASASTDPLTGLPNRRYFDEFSSLLAGRRRSGDALAVLMIDIDKFKGLNDTYGHPVGDEVLRSVATAITTAVRDQDVPARIGGEEFAVLLRNPGPSVALEVGERVRRAVRELDLGDMGVPGVSVSVGVADATGPDEPIHALVDRADRALLRAKRAGRDRVVAG